MRFAFLAMLSFSVFQPDCDAQDRHCGPRCVAFLLRQYGKEADLLSLIEELEENVEQFGVSMAELQRSLVRHGCASCAISLRDVRDISGGVFLLLHRPPATDSSLGHFVCAWRTPDGRWHEFSPPASTSDTTFERMIDDASSVALVVAKDQSQLSDCRLEVRKFPWLSAPVVVWSLIALAAAVGIPLCRPQSFHLRPLFGRSSS